MSRERPLRSAARLLCGVPERGRVYMGTSDGRGPPYGWFMANFHADDNSLQCIEYEKGAGMVSKKVKGK